MSTRAWPSPARGRVLGLVQVLRGCGQGRGLLSWPGGSLCEAAVHSLGTVLGPDVQRVQRLQSGSIGVMSGGLLVQIAGLLSLQVWIRSKCAAIRIIRHISLACFMHPVLTLLCAQYNVMAGARLPRSSCFQESIGCTAGQRLSLAIGPAADGYVSLLLLLPGTMCMSPTVGPALKLLERRSASCCCLCRRACNAQERVLQTALQLPERHHPAGVPAGRNFDCCAFSLPLDQLLVSLQGRMW